MGRELLIMPSRNIAEGGRLSILTPADFFRTMEDASAFDLDWFWRGWFYTIDNVDIAIDSVKWYQADLKGDPVKREYPQTITRENHLIIFQKSETKKMELNSLLMKIQPW